MASDQNTIRSHDMCCSWVVEIRSFLEKGTEEDETVPVSIFSVPKMLSANHPEAYTPQLISLGPYHHLRENLMEMDRDKLVVAKRVVQSNCNNLTYEQLVNEILGVEKRIRACYHKHFNNVDEETLAWLMAIDALFLVEFLNNYKVEYPYSDQHQLIANNNSCATHISSFNSYWVDTRGRKVRYDAILRDIFMLENQIPLFVLNKIFHLRCITSLDHKYNRDDQERLTILPTMLVRVCQELSPLKLIILEDNNIIIPTSYSTTHYLHLLDLLYHLIVQGVLLIDKEDDHDVIAADDHDEIMDNQNIDDDHIISTGADGDHNKISSKSKSKNNTTTTTTTCIGGDHRSKNSNNNNNIDKADIFGRLWSLIKNGNMAFLVQIRAIIFIKPFKALLILPWKLISRLPFVSKIIASVVQDNIILTSIASSSTTDVKEAQTSFSISSKGGPTHHPSVLLDEIIIPSVTALHDIGVNFCPIDGSIDTLNFDRTTGTLHLPIVTVDVNTEVILRNLVAYETMEVVSGQLVLARYTEFMNGIIDTGEDARLLREKKIIVNHLSSDNEVAELWNGMSRSVRLTKVPFLDEVIDGINAYYQSNWKVKAYTFVKKMIYQSWELLLVLATLLLLSLMTLQSFCTIYSCPRFFRTIPTNATSYT